MLSAQNAARRWPARLGSFEAFAQQYQELGVGRTDSFGLCRTQIVHVLEIMPYGAKKALPGHKGYIVSSSCWILVPRHLVFSPRYPFH